MFFLSRLYRHPAFVLGMREVSPQSPGIAAWGLMTGVAMVKSGMSVFEASAMTLLVFAGSSQLAASISGTRRKIVWSSAANLCGSL